MMNFKKMKRRVNFKNNFIELMQEFVEQEIPAEERKGFDSQMLTNYLTALIHPKEIPRGQKNESPKPV